MLTIAQLTTTITSTATISNFVLLLISLIALFLLLIIIDMVIKRLKFNRMKPFSLDLVKSFIPEDFTFEPIKLVTDDGYHLQLFRITHSKNYNPELKPVIFRHGIGASCCVWLVSGPKKSSALILARKG